MISPFGWKAARFIQRPPEKDAWINILNGAVRSSKTWAVNAKLLKLLASGFWPGGMGLITGNSRKTAQNNIIKDLCDWAGPRRSHYSIGNGELKLFDRSFMVLGAGDEQAHRSIKGATVGIWIADEITLYPQSFWDMGVSRMSLPMSRCYATTNPASPNHYLKTDWLDNPDKLVKGDIWSDTFTLDDNPNIEPKKKDELKRSFTGVFYQRNILGLWVLAEGAIYKDCVGPDTYYNDSTRKLGLLSQNGHSDRFVCIDVGTINAMCMLDIYDDGKVLWVENEYYWDSVKTYKQKTNSEYATDFLDRFCSTNPTRWPVAIVDPSAASFKLELVKNGVVVLSAENDVLDGIRVVSSMLYKRTLRIHERCTNLKNELDTYAWDAKAAKIGAEKPIKTLDHACFIAGTKVETPEGPRNIEELQVGEYVNTVFGPSKITAINCRPADTVSWNNTRVTPDHPIGVNRGWLQVGNLQGDEILCGWLDKYRTNPGKVNKELDPEFIRELCLFHSERLMLVDKPDLWDEKYELVYNLKTSHGCYFANGVLVSNCDALRYGVFTKMPAWRVAS